MGAYSKEQRAHRNAILMNGMQKREMTSLGLNPTLSKDRTELSLDGKKVKKFTKEKAGGYSIEYGDETALGGKKDSL